MNKPTVNNKRSQFRSGHMHFTQWRRIVLFCRCWLGHEFDSRLNLISCICFLAELSCRFFVQIVALRRRLRRELAFESFIFVRFFFSLFSLSLLFLKYVLVARMNRCRRVKVLMMKQMMLNKLRLKYWFQKRMMRETFITIGSGGGGGFSSFFICGL